MAEASERVVLVTGAGSGIGAAVVRRIAGPGTDLVVHTRANRTGADKAVADATAAGARALVALGDLADPAVPRRLVEYAVERFGRLDQIVSNAGAADRRPIGVVDEGALARAYRLMPQAFLGLATAALPFLERSSWGRVVAVSSFVAHVYSPETPFPVTAAAKAGVEALARSLAAQLAPLGVTVNCVVPGFTRKDTAAHSALSEEAWQRAAQRTPMGRIATPDDIAAAIAFLLSRDAAFITGQIIRVDGGLGLG
jgi:3-oxoacyl-[acyl-carrier protein] reductase